MATATSTQWAEVYRETMPAYAASDVFAKTAVALASASDWQVVPVTGATPYLTVEPVGIARDDQQQGHSVTVYDGVGALIRVVAGATVFQGENVGVVLAGATNYAHPVSGTVGTVCFFGPVSGASGSNVQRVGVAVEEAIPGEQFLMRVSPKQLSGLS